MPKRKMLSAEKMVARRKQMEKRTNQIGQNFLNYRRLRNEENLRDKLDERGLQYKAGAAKRKTNTARRAMQESDEKSDQRFNNIINRYSARKTEGAPAKSTGRRMRMKSTSASGVGNQTAADKRMAALQRKRNALANKRRAARRRPSPKAAAAKQVISSPRKLERDMDSGVSKFFSDYKTGFPSDRAIPKAPKQSNKRPERSYLGRVMDDMSSAMFGSSKSKKAPMKHKRSASQQKFLDRESGAYEGDPTTRKRRR